jgi:hypothetical protein
MWRLRMWFSTYLLLLLRGGMLYVRRRSGCMTRPMMKPRDKPSQVERLIRFVAAQFTLRSLQKRPLLGGYDVGKAIDIVGEHLDGELIGHGIRPGTEGKRRRIPMSHLYQCAVIALLVAKSRCAHYFFLCSGEGVR